MSISLSWNGDYLVVGTDKGVVCFFDRKGDQLWTYNTGGWVRSVAISHNGEYVVSGSENGRVDLFSRSGHLWTFRTAGEVDDVSIGGDYIAVASDRVYLLIKYGKPLWKEKMSEWVWRVALSPEGKYVVAGDGKGEVRLMNRFRSGKVLFSYMTGGSVESVAISFYGNYVAVGSRDSKVYFFDSSGRVLWIYKTAGGYVNSVSMSTDGRYVAAGGDDNNLYFFDKQGDLLWKHNLGSIVERVAVSNAGEYIAAGTYDGHVYLFSRGGDLLGEYLLGGVIEGLSISSRGNCIAAGSRNCKIALFTIGEANKPPIAYIDEISPNPATEGDIITLKGHGVDPDGQVVAYEWKIGDKTYEGGCVKVSLPPGTYKVYFRVKDDGNTWSNWTAAELVVKGRAYGDLAYLALGVLLGASVAVILMRRRGPTRT